MLKLSILFCSCAVVEHGIRLLINKHLRSQMFCC